MPSEAEWESSAGSTSRFGHNQEFKSNGIDPVVKKNT